MYCISWHVAVTFTMNVSKGIFFLYNIIIFLSCTLAAGLEQLPWQLFHICLFYVLKYRFPFHLLCDQRCYWYHSPAWHLVAVLHIVATLFPPDPATSLFSLERSFILLGTLEQYLHLLSHGWYICNVTPAETFSNQRQSFQTVQELIFEWTGKGAP